jgi:hypothetical protein
MIGYLGIVGPRVPHRFDAVSYRRPPPPCLDDAASRSRGGCSSSRRGRDEAANPYLPSFCSERPFEFVRHQPRAERGNSRQSCRSLCSLSEARYRSGLRGTGCRAYLSTQASGTSPPFDARDRFGADAWYDVQGFQIAEPRSLERACQLPPWPVAMRHRQAWMCHL